jgi:hypothetical protein
VRSQDSPDEFRLCRGVGLTVTDVRGHRLDLQRGVLASQIIPETQRISECELLTPTGRRPFHEM